jgi:hypothetical protein
MTKENIKWLKENEPWEYDALYGDPVTGQTTSDDSGCISVIFIGLIALGIWGLVNLIRGI